MVFSPTAGADEALGPFVFRTINILSICQFLFYLFPLNDMLTVFHIQMHWQHMLTLSSNRSRSPQGHDLYTHCSTLAMLSFFEISLPVPEEKIFKGSLPYMGMAAILVM